MASLADTPLADADGGYDVPVSMLEYAVKLEMCPVDPDKWAWTTNGQTWGARFGAFGFTANTPNLQEAKRLLGESLHGR